MSPEWSIKAVLRGGPEKSHKATRLTKVRWLLKRQVLWEGHYNRTDPLWGDLARQMQEEGLYSQKTYILDVIGSVWRHVVLARRLRAEGYNLVTPDKD